MATRTGDRGAYAGKRADVGAGWILFASIMMIMGGCFAIFEGIAAVPLRGALP